MTRVRADGGDVGSCDCARPRPSPRPPPPPPPPPTPTFAFGGKRGPLAMILPELFAMDTEVVCFPRELTQTYTQMHARCSVVYNRTANLQGGKIAPPPPPHALTHPTPSPNPPKWPASAICGNYEMEMSWPQFTLVNGAMRKQWKPRLQSYPQRPTRRQMQLTDHEARSPVLNPALLS